MSELNRGVLYGASAYLMWGLSTLYWPLLSSAGPLEILAHRMVWSLLAVFALLAARRHWRWLLGVLRRPRLLLLLAGAATVISVNWGLFIVAVTTNQTSQAALGYFINPLVSVVFGVIIFSERLRAAQWVAVGLGGVAVAVLTYAYGSVPWISLGLAFAFATYSVLKKFARLDGVESLTIETLLMLLPALGYVVFLESTGVGTFTQSVPHAALLVGSGLVTALPLLLFGAAAHRIPMTLIGLLQFMVPVMQFLFAWLVFEEALPLSRWIGFAVVWVALVVFAADMVRTARAAPRVERGAAGGAGPAGPVPDAAPAPAGAAGTGEPAGHAAGEAPPRTE